MKRELRSVRTTLGGFEMKQNAITRQLTSFGLKPTESMCKQPAGQIVIDLLEIAYPPIDLEKKIK